MFWKCLDKLWSLSCVLIIMKPLDLCNDIISSYVSCETPVSGVYYSAHPSFLCSRQYGFSREKRGAVASNHGLWKKLLKVVLSCAGVHRQLDSVCSRKSVGTEVPSRQEAFDDFTS